MDIAYRFRRAFSALSILVFIGGCGGSGTADDPASTPTPSSATTTGSVGIMLTDMPMVEFDEFKATISRIELLGDGNHTTIFSGRETVDFLRLETFTELFVIAEDVPAGDYSKIRLILDGLRLVKDGQETEVRLPGNGKVDLNPRQRIFVTPGTTLLVELDVDVKKSLKITRTAAGEKFEFRPVIFVKTSDQDAGSKLARVFGTVDSIEADEDRFVLCQEGRVSDPDDDGDSDAAGEPDNDCLTVQVSQDTGIFGADGEPADLTLLGIGDPLTAIGSLGLSEETVAADDDSDGESESNEAGDANDADSDSDSSFDDDDLVLEAYVIELGELGTFERLKGEITEDFDGANGEFGLHIGPGQGFGDDSNVTGLVQMGTRIFDKAANRLDETALVRGQTGHFDGVLTLSDTDPDMLKTSLIVLDPDASMGETISGDITMVSIDEREIMLMVGSVERCVSVPEGTDITVVTITDTGTETGPAELAELMSGWPAEVFGEEGDGCFLANTVRAEDDQRTGQPANRTPVADAGPDQSVETGMSVMLDGSGSFDEDGDTLNYNWTLTAPAGSSATLDDPTLVMPVFGTDVDGAYVAELVVNDGTEDSVPDSVTVTSGATVTPAPDGVALYEANCSSSGCHGPLSSSSVRGKSAGEIQAAIDADVAGMGRFSVLSSEDVQAIADALAQ